MYGSPPGAAAHGDGRTLETAVPLEKRFQLRVGRHFGAVGGFGGFWGVVLISGAASGRLSC